MLRPRWRKVVRDLASNRLRTTLVVLSIAVGVFAIGMIAGTREVLPRALSASYLAVNPSSATLYTEKSFDQNMVDSVRNMRDVAEAEGRRRVDVRVRTGTDQWQSLRIFAIPDYRDIRVDQIRSQTGAWPPPKHELLIERMSVGMVKARVGDKVTVELADGKLREMRVAGLTHDLNQFPSVFSGTAYGYVTSDTLDWLGETNDYNELHIVAAGNKLDEKQVTRVSIEVRDKLEKSGTPVLFTWQPKPGKHPMEDFIPPILLLLGALGVLSLVASGFLVVNTISAILTQQTRQIGMMKAVGGRNSQIVAMYLGMVLIFGALSLIIAVPLGALAAYAFTSYLAGLINFDLAGFSLPPSVLLAEIAVGLMVPILTALWPVIAGVRVTVREAISSYGLGKGQFGRGPFDRLLERVRGLSRPMLISLRNTFRRKGRLALTLITLTLAGAIFVAIVSVQASTALTVQDAMKYWNYDIQVQFARPYAVEKMQREALTVPGVISAESWGFTGIRRLRPNDTESANIFMVAPPAQTRLLNPTILHGRWLLPEDRNAVVLNTDVTKDEKDVKVGDEIVLKIEGRKTKWTVVGIAKGILSGPIAYANYPYYADVVREVGKASGVQVVTAQSGAAYEAQVSQALEAHFKRIGMRVSSTTSTATIRGRIEAQFNIIIVLLLIMAVLLATVGGLGLMGTMSINVIERTREIGVMRAVGASDWAVLRIVIVEGVLIGFLSWLLGVVIALPLSKLLSDAVGSAFVQAPLSYTFSTNGALLWLGMVLMIAALASFLPARSASRLTVREVLAYE